MVKSTLKRCPFCGSLATYVWDDVNEIWMAGCTNDKCIVSVNTAMAYGWPFWSEDMETAEREWNKRAEAGDGE